MAQAKNNDDGKLHNAKPKAKPSEPPPATLDVMQFSEDPPPANADFIIKMLVPKDAKKSTKADE